MLFATALPAFADTTVTVTPPSLAVDIADVMAHTTKWFFYNDESDTIDNTLGSFVTGPAITPEGIGSAQISVTGTQRRNIATYQFSGTPLASITVLKFSTYNPSSGNAGSANRSAYLNFNVDFNGSDTWQKRLVYVPSQNGTVVQNSWQDWDAINGGAAMWAYSGTTWPGTAISGTTLRTWNDVLTSYPGVRVRVTDSWLGLRVGEPYADGYTDNIDAFKFGTAAGVTTYDFDPVVASGEITSPTDLEHVTGSLHLAANYSDDDVPNADNAVQWAVRQGTCAAGTGTVLGNVDGHSDVASWDGNTFSFDTDVSSFTPGAYCFVFNPTDDAGQPDVRETRNFFIDAPLVGPPTRISECKNSGWKTFNNPSFSNQGKCVSYVRQHAHSILGNIRYNAYGLNRTAQFFASTAEDGAFQYSDAHHDWYRVIVKSVKVDGHDGWFAGRVWQASNHAWVGQWLFAKVKDSSPHQIWGSFTTQSAALNGVASMSTPTDGPFNTLGALVVH